MSRRFDSNEGQNPHGQGGPPTPYGQDVPDSYQGPAQSQQWDCIPETAMPYQGGAYGQLYRPQHGPQQAVYVNADNGNNTSLAPVTSLTTGLLALFTAWIPIVGLVAWVLAPIAIIFGILGVKRGKAEHKIMSIMGLVSGGIALLICFAYLLIFVVAALDA